MRTKSMNVKINEKTNKKELYMGKYLLSDLAKVYQTPLYVFDEPGVRSKLDTFKKYFVSNKFDCEVVFASKAFIAPYLVKMLSEYNFSIDAVSLGDMYLIEKSGFNMNKVVLHGNNKSYLELQKAINANVEYIIVDNLTELTTLNNIANERQVKVKTLFRINPGIEAHTHAYIETSLLSSKFGESIYDEEVLNKIMDVYKTSKYLVLEGFHSHIGSQINNPDSFVAEVKTMCNFIKRMENKYNVKFSTLDLGGGFGIKYLDSDTEINLPDMLTKIVNSTEAILGDHIKKLMIEPGRSIVGDECVTLYTCGGVKTTYGGKKYAFIDGGMTDNIRPALYQAKYTVDVCENVETTDELVKLDLAGKCCESGDFIAQDILIPLPKKGDTIVTYSTGAYCYSMSMNYNGLGRGAVIFVGDEVNVAIRKESFEEQFSTCVFRKEKKMKIFDTHSDMLYDLYTQDLLGNKDRFTNFHVKELNNSVVRGGIWTMYSPDDFNLLEAVKIAQSKIDLTNLKGFNVVFGLEGLRNLEKPEDMYKLYDLGFRHAMLTWNEENKYATGVAGEATRGLMEDGKKVLRIMEELDMIIDLAHLNEKSFYDVLAFVKKPNKIIYSHGCCKDLCGHRRNVTLEQMKALKKVDGLLGLTLAKGFISKNDNERDLEHFLDHLDYAVSVMGIDNICFGFDFMNYLSDFPNDNIYDVEDATKAYKILDGMRRRGYSEEEINKVAWDNFYKRYNDKIVLKGE